MNFSCFGPLSLVEYWFAPQTLRLECWSALNIEMDPTSPGAGEYLALIAITLALEFVVYFLFLKKRFVFFKVVRVNLFLNLATHPLVTFLFPLLIAKAQMSVAGYITAAEIFAPLVETILLVFLFRIPLALAAVSSFLANLTSWALGLWLVSAFG